jgi:hypothetical protein
VSKRDLGGLYGRKPGARPHTLPEQRMLGCETDASGRQPSLPRDLALVDPRRAA